MRLPDFIVLGAQKAATSAIHETLRMHPDIFMARTEVHYFNLDYNYERGLSYYGSFFEEAAAEEIVGEVTPAYLFAPHVAERITSDLPGAKLLACLRNPVDRAYSAYRMQVNKGSETRSFMEAVRKDPNYTDRGRYYEQLRRYDHSIDSGQLLVLFYEDLLSDPQTFYASVVSFIGGRAQVLPTPLRANVSGVPRLRAVPRLLNLAYRTRNAIRESRFRSLVDNRLVDMYSRRVRNRIASWNRSPREPDPIPANARSFIVDALREDIEALDQYLHRDLQHWL